MRAYVVPLLVLLLTGTRHPCTVQGRFIQPEHEQILRPR